MTGGARGRTVRGAAGAVATLVAASLLVGCSDDGEREDAARAVDSLREGLVAGDLADVPLTGATPEEATAELEAVVAGLGDVDPQVTVGGVDVDGDAGTATLDWAWELGGQTWSHTSTVALRDEDDEWRVTWAPTVVESSLAEGEVLRADRTAAVRGDVLAGDGTPIVTLRDVVRFGIDKSRIDAATAQASARTLATAVGVDPDAFEQRVAAAGERAYVEAIVLRAAEADLNLLGGTPGIAAIPDQVPLAPNRAFAAPILGTVGEATAEIVAESDGAVGAGDVVGLGGLQRRYDAELRGTDGLRVVVVPAEGSDAEPRELHTAEAAPGAPLATTLDIDLQGLAEGLLADVGPASALVAVRPSDGAVLAAANGPGTAGQNAATYGQYAPGSTFKVVTSLALLRAGIGPDDTVACPARITVDGRVFENYDDYPAGGIGEITLRQAVASSCNTAFIGSADALPDGALAEAAAALGLGVDQDLGFPAYFGQVPAPETETEAAAETIGQGRVLASPMAMAGVAASVVEGRAVLPTLLPEHTADAVPAPAPLTADEAAALQDLMRAVVTDGSGRLLADLPGAPVGAKTGTAEFGTETPPATHAWMIATQGDLAVAVFVEEGASGSGTAGPLLRSFLAGAAG